MRTFSCVLSAMLLVALSVADTSAQNITNTLGTSGTFTIKDGSNDYFSLLQSSGNATFYRNLDLGNQENSSSTVGVITRGGVPFIHNFKPATKDGFNTFVGINSGNFTMGEGVDAFSGSYNTGVGYATLELLSSGSYNSAFGYRSLRSTTSGQNNSAFGHSALSANSGGSSNSAFGFGALSYNNGSNNSAFGERALLSNEEGSGNSAFGTASLQLNKGSQNTAIGTGAGSNVTTGSNLTVIGYIAEASAATATNEITLGNGDIATLRCKVTTITGLSDARDKKNIRDLPLGLEFLMKVTPRLFNWDRRDWYASGKADGSKMQASPVAGFIAQELDEVQKSEQADWLNLVLKNNPDRLEATPGNLLPVVVKAVQELKKQKDEEIAQLKKENEDLKGRVLAQQEEIQNFKALKAKVAALEQAIAQPSLVQGVGMIEERDTNKK